MKPLKKSIAKSNNSGYNKFFLSFETGQKPFVFTRPRHEHEKVNL